ncbi:MAG: A/G-specific adenine glycosylase [Gammaproteobacteria bacterium]|nr:A/G-specific adenine glycosylase [Gammaproteobacteria bacterium]
MINRFTERLARWQKFHGRHDLPWQSHGVYETWISEIMLQQTQVKVVIPYYKQFIVRFPDVQTLANAPLDDVLSHWAGLGYYSRARNLHKTAQIIVENYEGKIPKNLDKLKELPGIGRSTAGAILSLGFGLRGVIQDGNVKRLLARLFAITGDLSKSKAQNDLWSLADSLTPQEGEACRSHTQGMMDLGSIICRRIRPDCPICPFQNDCLAFQQNSIAKFPAPKQANKRQDELWVVLQIVNQADETLFIKRPAKGIWGGLYAPPIGPSLKELGNDMNLNAVAEAEFIGDIAHAFSHFKVRLEHYRLKIGEDHVRASGEWQMAQLFQKGIPAPIQKLLDKDSA